MCAEQRYLSIDQVEALAHGCGYPTTFSKHRSYAERRCEVNRLVVLFAPTPVSGAGSWPR